LPLVPTIYELMDQYKTPEEGVSPSAPSYFQLRNPGSVVVFLTPARAIGLLEDLFA
jgi:hypothetical protein